LFRIDPVIADCRKPGNAVCRTQKSKNCQLGKQKNFPTFALSRPKPVALIGVKQPHHNVMKIQPPMRFDSENAGNGRGISANALNGKVKGVTPLSSYTPVNNVMPSTVTGRPVKIRPAGGSNQGSTLLRTGAWNQRLTING
jgi:hypothetical protein